MGALFAVAVAKKLCGKKHMCSSSGAVYVEIDDHSSSRTRDKVGGMVCRYPT